jgi:hypothetical protein
LKSRLSFKVDSLEIMVGIQMEGISVIWFFFVITIFSDELLGYHLTERFETLTSRCKFYQLSKFTHQFSLRSMHFEISWPKNSPIYVTHPVYDSGFGLAKPTLNKYWINIIRTYLFIFDTRKTLHRSKGILLRCDE